MSTAPFSSAAANQLRRGGEQVFTVTATGGGRTIVLDVVDGSLTYDEFWTPHVQLSLTARIPDTEADILALDPRGSLVRLTVVAGYVLENRTVETYTIARLVLRERSVNRPADTVTLQASSDECLVQDAGIVGPVSAEYPGAQNWLLGHALAVFLERATGTAPTLSVLTDGDITVELAYLDKWASSVNEWSDQVGAWVYHDGLNGWVLRNRPERTGSSAVQLTVGPDGTVTDSASIVTREGEDWANDVFVAYLYTSGGVTSMRVGRAWISGGDGRAYTVNPTVADPWGVPRAGIKRRTYERTGQVTRAAANAAAAALLARRASQGRQVGLTAVSAYWLRPGATVTVQLATGDQERHLVSRVSFRVPSGEMTVNTRLPDLAPITTGE